MRLHGGRQRSTRTTELIKLMRSRRLELPNDFEQLVTMVEADHARTTEAISRLITMRAGLFSLAGALWTAAVGAGIATGSSALHFTALAAILVIGGLDLVYSGHYKTSRRQARRHERILNANYKRISRGNTPHGISALAQVLATAELGQTSTFRNTRARDLWKFRDLRTWVFIALAAAALVLGVLALAAGDDNEGVCVQTSPDTVIRLDTATATPVSGDARIVDCPAVLANAD